MRTKNQIRANRANAKKSTGPRTQKGKARSSQNALKHGLLANDAVLPGEDPADFDRHLRSFEDTYLPRNRVEKEIVRQIADLAWRMQRLSRIETAVIAAGMENSRRFNNDTGPMPEDREGQTNILGWAMLTRTKLLNPDFHFSFGSANHRVDSDAFIYAGLKALKALRRSTPNG